MDARPVVRGVSRPRDNDDGGDTQSKSKLALVHERATPRAHTLLNTRARVRACSHAQNTHTREHTVLHT